MTYGSTRHTRTAWIAGDDLTVRLHAQSPTRRARHARRRGDYRPVVEAASDRGAALVPVRDASWRRAHTFATAVEAG
jgi:hypothetical protein